MLIEPNNNPQPSTGIGYSTVECVERNVDGDKHGSIGGIGMESCDWTEITQLLWSLDEINTPCALIGHSLYHSAVQMAASTVYRDKLNNAYLAGVLQVLPKGQLS